MLLARQLISQDLLFKDVDYGSLKITENGADVLFHDKKVYGRLEEEKVGTSATGTSYDRQLFEKLRIKRKELADRQNIPPYAIFSDRSLVEMATYFPQSRENLLAINGVGVNKLNRYGNVFLHIIRHHCEANRISEKPKSSPILKTA